MRAIKTIKMLDGRTLPPGHTRKTQWVSPTEKIPTNHGDIPARRWMEDEAKRFVGSYIGEDYWGRIALLVNSRYRRVNLSGTMGGE